MAYNSAPLSVYDIAPFVKTGDDITTILNTTIAGISSIGAISIPPGLYFISNQINITTKQIRFILNGATLKLGANITGSMFYNDTAGGKYIFENGIIDGNKSTYTVSVAGINIGSSASAPEFYNMTIQNFSAYGVQCAGTGEWIVQDSNSNSNDGVGWYGQVVGTVHFENSGANNNGGGGGAFAGSLGTDIIGGKWKDNTFLGVGPYWGNNGASFALHARVIGTTCSGNTGQGIAIGQGIKYVTVVGNICYDNTDIGINVDTILNDGVTAVDTFTTVTGNTVKGSQLPIRWNGAISGCIVGNTIIDPSVAGNGGVYVLGNSSKVSIDSNHFIGTYAYIQVASGSSAIVGPSNTFTGLGSTISPYLGSGVVKSSASYFSESVNTSFGNILPASLYNIDTTSASFTKTLPSVALVGNGVEVTFYKKVAANTISVQPFAGDMFYGPNTATAVADVITDEGPGYKYVSITDGTNLGWFRYSPVA